MDANVTSPQSEPDQDNSSLQNPSTNPAEAGTTDETRDEDHETSSIEALNWSEVEEEELAAAQQAEAEALASQGKSLPGAGDITNVNKKSDNDDEKSTNNGSSTNGSTVLVNDEGKVLSTSLLQSINSSSSDEDPQARKLSVIENWASEVTNAVERGEIEMAEDFPDETGVTGDEQDVDEQKESIIRKRRGEKLSSEMVSSMMSSASNGESSVDPLSNAPVLDDGPIWNKGPRSYTFQENRRINQKLTFCLLIAVVLAIGLGLGNLVAHQECEAEYKSSQQPQSPMKSVEKDPIPQNPDSLEIKATDSSLPHEKAFTSLDSNNNEEGFGEDPHYKGSAVNTDTSKERETAANSKPAPAKKFTHFDDPMIDPKYKVHTETLSKVVHTLDQLSRKIDQFENTTRKLQGVLVIPEESEEKSEDSSSLYDEKVYRESDLLDEVDNEEMDDEMAEIDELIDAIEQTPQYVNLQRTLKRLEELDKIPRRRSSLFSSPGKVPRSDEEKENIDKIVKSIQQLKDFQKRFVKRERKRLKDEGKIDPEFWRTPEEYSDEEKKSIRAIYKSTFDQFTTLVKDKNPDPIFALFGAEEEDDERDAIGPWPWFDPDTDEDIVDDFTKNIDKAFGYEEMTSPLDDASSDVSHQNLEEPQQEETTVLPERVMDVDDLKDKPSGPFGDDLIVLQHVKDELDQSTQSHPDSGISAAASNEDIQHVQNDQGKFQSVEPEVETKVPVISDNSQATSEKASSTQKVASNISPKQTTKSKKVGSNKPNGTGNNGNKPQSNNVKTGKRDQKQKEQKKQGKTKLKSGNVSDNRNSGTGNGQTVNGNGKLKMASKLKKLKNLESNKVFENIKGKSNENRRGSQGTARGKQDARFAESRYVDANGNRRTSKGTSSQNGKKASRENNYRGETSGESRSKQKMKSKQNNSNQKPDHLNNNDQNKRHPPNGGPKYYDPRDIRDQENRGDTRGDFEKPLKHKLTNVELSSKETQHRQQKQEFNSDSLYNSYNSGHQNNEKKSKNWQNKERDRSRERPRERSSAWGN